MKIFVSIVSYRDPLLIHTVNSLLDNASKRYEIIIGIFEQTRIEDSLVTTNPEMIKKQNIKYKRIDPEYSDGVSWARHINSLQVENEDFFYQVDSHMLFDQNWDQYLLDDWYLGNAKHNTNKIIITGTCKNFDIDEAGIPIVLPEGPKLSCKVKYFLYQGFDIVAAHGETFPATEDIHPAIHICAGNFFTHIDWLKDVGIDPKLYFEPEEGRMVLGSFAADYHMYHPRSIHCYHYINTSKYITKQWFEPLITMEKYTDLVHNSYFRWQKYLKEIDQSILKRYYEYSGLDYINKKIDPKAFTDQITIKPEETNSL